MNQHTDTNNESDTLQSKDQSMSKLYQRHIRSVVVPNATLQLGQCGLPKRIALDLYRTKLAHRLLSRKHVDTLDEAEYAIACEWPEVLDELAELLHREPVLLLFTSKIARSVLQAFEPRLIEGSAIQIHPTIAQQLGIDFSGQCVFVRLPRSRGGHVETQELLNSAQSFLSQRNGNIDQTIPKEAAIGIRYLTLDAPQQARVCNAIDSKPTLIGSTTELELAMELGRIRLHDKITVTIPHEKTSDDSLASQRMVITTAGRYFFNQQLPIGLPFYNEEIRDPKLIQILNLCLSQFGRGAAIQLVKDLTKMGWDTLRRSGHSISMNDLKIPTEKKQHCADARKQTDKWLRLRQKGLLSDTELQSHTFDSWCHAHYQTTQDIDKELGSSERRCTLLSLAQGSNYLTGLDQISGMIRVVNVQYQSPLITANYCEGLSTTQYFRHRLDSKSRAWAIRQSKRLRRVSRVAQKLNAALREIYVSIHDCGATEGVVQTAIDEGIEGIKFANRVVGRISLHRIASPVTGETIVERNQIITLDIAESLERLRVDRIEVRSPTMCRAPEGICQLCYGIQPHTRGLPEIGERIGSQAALAISDAATKIGEARWYGSNNPWVVAPQADPVHLTVRSPGRVHFDETKCAVNRHGQTVVVRDDLRVSVCDEKGETIEQIDVPYASVLKVKNNDEVGLSQHLAESTPEIYRLIAEHSGRIRLNHLDVQFRWLCEGQKPRIVRKTNGSAIPTLEVIDDQGTIRQTRYLYSGTQLFCGDGDRVSPGDVLAEWRRPKRKADPTRGNSPLPKWVATTSHLESLFNLTVPTGEAVMAEFDGELSITQVENGVHLTLVSFDGRKRKEYIVPHSKSLFNFYAPTARKAVSAGELLSLGRPSWHDTKRVLGPKHFADKWLHEMLLIHHMNRLKIAEQHFELALRKMISLSSSANTHTTT